MGRDPVWIVSIHAPVGGDTYLLDRVSPTIKVFQFTPP